MQTQFSFSEKNIEPWVYALILLQVIIWTLAPTLIRNVLPMDALEGTVWGHQLEWGYDKNPFMNAWLTALAVKLGNKADWSIYFFSQLSVAICFFSIWELGKKIVGPLNALVAIILLATTQYYNLHAIDFNDNTLELGLWGLTILCFYRALQHRSSDLNNTSKYSEPSSFPNLLYWLLTGVFAALAMMTKYFVVMLLIPCFIFMLLYPKTRAEFKNPYFYLGLLVFFIIITPHFVWLTSHDYITINYAFNRVESKPFWWNHIFYPAQFAWQQIEVFLPVLVIWLFSFGKLSSKTSLTQSQRIYSNNEKHFVSFDKTFLLVVGLGPLLLILLLSLLTGMHLRAGWGQPLLNLWTLLLVAFFPPVLSRSSLIRFFSSSLIIIIGTASIYCFSLYQAREPSTANFPGEIIARSLETEWHNRYGTPLKYVVGARWIAGNIAYYSKDNPSVFIDAEKSLSPWIDDANLRKEGAIFVWDPTERWQMLPSEIQKRYPQLTSLKIMHFSWKRNLTMKPVEISVAVLPPIQHTATQPLSYPR